MNPIPQRDMNPTKPRGLWSLLVAVGLLLSTSSTMAQHGHLNAGAVGTTIGDKLLWSNGAAFAESSGFVINMTMGTSGTYNGLYNSGPTLTALPATVANGGPAAFAANLGSVIAVQMTLESGPEGGTFSFWESGSMSPTFSVGIGATTPLWELSDTVGGAGAAGADPYGHIHGRRFTAAAPGDYVIGFQLFDTSDLAPGASAFHAPSDILNVRFVAMPIPEPGTMTLVGLGALGLLVRANRARRHAQV